MLLAFALILGYVEALIPLPFGVPGMKLGLPNLAVLITMYRFGNKEALTVNVARVFLGGFLFGNLSAVLYSLSGALVSFLVMLAIKRLPCFSITGVSVAGGTPINCAQLVVAACGADVPDHILSAVSARFRLYYRPVPRTDGGTGDEAPAGLEK